jgi:predicted O-methyltransferase YrrM
MKSIHDYEFSQNWFEYGEKLWPNLIHQLPQRPKRKFMEIGSFEGRSAVWMMENMMTPEDSLYCIDTWEGGREHNQLDMDMVKTRFDANISKASWKTKIPQLNIHAIRETSSSALSLYLRFHRADDGWDFIYIDGSHDAQDVLRDALMAWELLLVGGVMVLDDYLWGDPSKPLLRPKMAIDAFVNICAPQISFMHIGYQVAIRKVDRE